LNNALTTELFGISSDTPQSSTRNKKATYTWLVFAYPSIPSHFGKSGFSAYFLRQIRISGFYPDFFCRSA